MSMAPRLAKWTRVPQRWAGQPVVLGQRVADSPSGRTSGVPHSGQVLGNFQRREPLGPLGEDRADHLGDDVAGLAHEHGVAGADVAAGDLVLVVQGGQADGRPGDQHRLEHRERGRDPGPPDGHLDVLEQGGALLGRVLVGDRPARGLGGAAQLLLEAAGVDLDHHPVDLVLEVVAVLGPVGDERLHLLEGGDDGGLGGHRQAGPLAEVEERGVGGEAHPRGQAERVAEHGQLPGAVTLGSFWRREPEAALRGLA